MPLKPSDNPVFFSELTALTTQSTGHPDTFNPNYQKLLDNTAFLKARGESNKQATDSKIAEIAGRVAGVEATSSVSVQKAVGLDWKYRNNPITFEMFTLGYTLIDIDAIAVIQGVSGDDSLDVADTSKLKAGDYYVLTDPSAVSAGVVTPVTVLVQIASILSGSRVRLTANLAQGWGATASLVRSSLKINGASLASAIPGDIYLTRAINIGTDLEGGAVVVRRSLNSALTRLYYRDGYRQAWTETGWSLRRTGGDIPPGFADYEYVLPMRGDGYLRLNVEGEAVSIIHLVALGTATGLGGFINPDLRPVTPLISTPAAAATGIMERPTLALAAYSSPSGNAQQNASFQISKDAAFANVLYDSGNLGPVLSCPLPAGVLTANTVFYWRGRVQDVAGLWSDYSTTASFTTAASFAYVLAPTITGPAANAADVPEQPTLSTSAFAATAGATDTHTSSQYQIRAASGSYAVPVWDSGEDTVNKVTIVVPAGKLLAGQQGYYVRARHKGSVKGWSEWSAESKFTTKAAFANIIGIALLATGGGAGTWSRIDENGATKVTDASFFSSHATYGAIQGQTIDGQDMIKVPAFYIKRGTISTGANAGKQAWWISDQPVAGFSIHPAFKNGGSDLAQFWVGKYQGITDASDGTKMGSKPGSAALTLIDFTALKARAEARNVGGVSGFSLWSIYQLAAIQVLALIEMGGADSQALIGRGNVNASGPYNVDHPIVTQATWRGIVGLWGNVTQAVDGIQTDSGLKLLIWDRNGNKSYQTTSRIVFGNAGNDRYGVTTAGDVGANYDLGDVFLPATVDASSSNGTYGDVCYYGQSCVLHHGGYWVSNGNAGLFATTMLYSAGTAGSNVGGRLSKI